MLMYGKMLKLAELSHFWADFGHLQKIFSAINFEPLDQTRQKFQLSKQKNSLQVKQKNSLQVVKKTAPCNII